MTTWKKKFLRWKEKYTDFHVNISVSSTSPNLANSPFANILGQQVLKNKSKVLLIKCVLNTLPPPPYSSYFIHSFVMHLQ